MNRIARLSLGFLCMILLLPAIARAADENAPAMGEEQKGNVIKPEEAKDNVGKKVVVEFVVVAGRTLEDKGIAFLNSSSDPGDPDGFTAFITKAGLNKFKEDAKIDDPVDHFNQKKIRVSGKIKKYKDKAEIEVNSPDQIQMVEEENKPEENKPDEEKKM
jgi:DNA/RNA endonuclease YhcR with UshA esterase domain